MKVVTQEKRFDDESAADAFVKSFGLTPLQESMLDQPEYLKWCVKKKRVTVTEKEY